MEMARKAVNGGSAVTHEALTRTFAFFDADGNGSIDPQEIGEVRYAGRDCQTDVEER